MLRDKLDLIDRKYINIIVVFLVVFVGVWSALSLMGIEKLASFFSVMVLSTTIIPVPTPPIVLYTGNFYPAIAVAIVGGIASALGCLLDYLIIGTASETKYFSKYKDSRILLKTQKYFSANGFLTLMFFAFTPFPFEPVKLLAIVSNYDVKLYALAISLSRGARYYILASFGAVFTLNQIIILTIIFIAILLLKQGIEHRNKKNLGAKI